MAIGIEVEILDISEENLEDIPGTCKSCVYWEFPDEFKTEKERFGTEKELKGKKREWFTQTLKEFGTCGKIVYCEGKPVGYAQFAPSTRLPNINSYMSKSVGKVEQGVVFLSCLYISNENLRGMGLGERLLTNIIEDLKRRGFKAIETFARRDNANNPSGPMAFYIKNSFHIKDNADPNYPLLRLFL